MVTMTAPLLPALTQAPGEAGPPCASRRAIREARPPPAGSEVTDAPALRPVLGSVLGSVRPGLALLRGLGSAGRLVAPVTVSVSVGELDGA